MTNVPASQRLPDIPEVANWAATLLILSAIPWFAVFIDNVLSAPVIALRAGFLAHGNETMLLLNIGYLMLAVSVLNGCKWIRITIVIVTAGFDLLMLNSVTRLGQAGGSEVGIVSLELMMFAWTVVLSSVGLVLLYMPASNTYIAQSEEYRAYLDRQNCDENAAARFDTGSPLRGAERAMVKAVGQAVDLRSGGDRRSTVRHRELPSLPERRRVREGHCCSGGLRRYCAPYRVVPRDDVDCWGRPARK